MTREIEYFYAAHSAFAYIGSALFLTIARNAGRQVVHRPIDLLTVMRTTGAPGTARGFTASLSLQRTNYFFRREIERWAEYRGAPVMQGIPTHHYNSIELPNCMLIAAAESGADVDGLSHAILQAHWRNDADHADPETLRAIADDIGCDGAVLLEMAGTPDVKARYEANTAKAIERAVFGSPTYFVDGDMFYGQDRLELVERALKTPFKDTWPKFEPAE